MGGITNSKNWSQLEQLSSISEFSNIVAHDEGHGNSMLKNRENLIGK